MCCVDSLKPQAKAVVCGYLRPRPLPLKLVGKPVPPRTSGDIANPSLWSQKTTLWAPVPVTLIYQLPTIGWMVVPPS